MLNIISYDGNANQNRSEIPFRLTRMVIIKKKKRGNKQILARMWKT